jgi:hypothetical protein
MPLSLLLYLKTILFALTYLTVSIRIATRIIKYYSKFMATISKSVRQLNMSLLSTSF